MTAEPPEFPKGPLFSKPALAALALGLSLVMLRWEIFRDGLWSFTAALLLFATEPSRATAAFNPKLLDYWVASASLVLWISWWSLNLRKQLKSGSSPPLTEALRRLLRSRIVSMAFWVLALFTLTAVWSPLIAPLDPNHQQDILLTRFQKPMSQVKYVRLTSPGPAASVQDPLIDRWIGFNRTLLYPSDKIAYVTYVERTDSSVTLIQGRVRKTMAPERLESTELQERTFLLGTDKFGRDILSRIVYGSRISLSIGFAAMVISVVVGSLVGVFAGYYGGWTDRLLMRTVDLILAFPGLFLILLIIAIFGNSLVWLILILGMTGWMGVARLVRGQILSLKEQEFILAAEALGFSKLRIVFRHLLPNALSPVIVAASLRIGTIILIEAGLSFLGLGVQPPTASWGNMINEGRDTLLVAWWISTMPGVAIVLVVTCFNVIGDGLRDVLDPRIRI